MLKLNSLRPWKLTDHFRYLRPGPCSHQILPCAVSFATTRGEFARRNLLGSLQSPAPRQVAVLACAVLSHRLDRPVDLVLANPLRRSRSLSFGSEPLSRSSSSFLLSPSPVFPLSTIAIYRTNRLPAGLSLIFSVCLSSSQSFLFACCFREPAATVVHCLCPPGWHCILNPLFWFSCWTNVDRHHLSFLAGFCSV